MNLKPVILKIGGSVITQKTKSFRANLTAINRISGEIAGACVAKLVIVHGGGSFGHPLAKRYSIKEGYNGSASQLLGFAKTHEAMVTLNALIIKALIQHNMPAVPVSPVSCLITKSGRIVTETSTHVNNLLETGVLPVLYGDAVLDHDLGFTVLSGDQLVASLATQLKAGQIVIGIDEDGLFTADPKYDPSAKLIEHCTVAQLQRMKIQTNTGSNSDDVTGGMRGKMSELAKAIEKGIPILMVNAAKPKRILKALKGEQVTGTRIQKS